MPVVVTAITAPSTAWMSSSVVMSGRRLGQSAISVPAPSTEMRGSGGQWIALLPPDPRGSRTRAGCTENVSSEPPKTESKLTKPGGTVPGGTDELGFASRSTRLTLADTHTSSPHVVIFGPVD